MFSSIPHSPHSHYPRLRPLSYPGTDVFLLCFCVDRRDSLEDVTDPQAEVMPGGGSWIQELEQHSPKTPIVLVANKVKVENSWVFGD